LKGGGDERKPEEGGSRYGKGEKLLKLTKKGGDKSRQSDGKRKTHVRTPATRALDEGDRQSELQITCCGSGKGVRQRSSEEKADRYHHIGRK